MVRVHLSLILSLVYVAAWVMLRTSGIAIEAGVDPRALQLPPAILGILVSLGYLFSIALHEWAQVRVLRAYGVFARRIVLMMFGGWIDVDPARDSKEMELRQAGVGPLVYLGLAALGWLVAGQTRSADLNLLAFAWANMNLLLLVSNLIPAIPLDLGKALRAVWISKRGAFQTTKWMVQLTQVLGWGLVIAGLAFFQPGLVIAAIFFYAAAEFEWERWAANSFSQSMRIAELALQLEPVEETDSLTDAVTLMSRAHSAILPVRMADRKAGLLALSQIRRIPHEKWALLLVKDVAEETPSPVNSEQSVESVVTELAASPYGVLPVVNGDGDVCGLIRYSDAMAVRQLRRNGKGWTKPRTAEVGAPVGTFKQSEMKKAA